MKLWKIKKDIKKGMSFWKSILSQTKSWCVLYTT